MKEIQIIRGEEFKVQVRKEIDEKDVFIEEYRRAARLLEEILESFQTQWDSQSQNGNLFFSNNHTEYSNNIIAFCGERGDGKTSAMMTFMNVAKNAREADKDDRIFQQESIVKRTKFLDAIHVDPSALDDVHNVLDIVVANMFRHFKRECEEGERQHFTDRRETLIKCFQDVYRALSLKKASETILREEFDDEGSIAKLSKLSESMRLKEYMSKLLRAYFEYMISPTNDCCMQNCAILISIDDLDLNISSAYDMSEEIRKYLILPGIVVIMAVRTKQMHLCVEEYNMQLFKQQFKEADRQQMYQEVQEMAERYVSKLLPLAHRIYLPKVQDFHDTRITYIGKKEDVSHEQTKEIASPVEFVLQKIYKKTGMIFIPLSQMHSVILPDNIRGMVSLIVLLDSMEDPAETESAQDSIRHKNILKLQNTYFREWLDTLPARNERELFVRQEMQKLVDYDAYMNLHVGTTTILDTLNEIYGGYKGSSTAKASDLFRNDTNWGMGAMCCVMNTLRYITRIHYKFEVKRYVFAVAFLYTIKLNLLATSKNERNQSGKELDWFLKSTIWGYDFLDVIPRVGYPNIGVPRARFVLPSVEIFNCVADGLGLPADIRLQPSNPVYVSHQVSESSQYRVKYILTWMIVGMFSNNYNLNSSPQRFQMLLWEVLIYNNSVLNVAEQVSLENFIVRMCMLDSLHQQLNFEILGVSYKEFQNVAEKIKEKNTLWMSLSKRIVMNVDIIQGIINYCSKNSDYKKKTDDEFERSKKLVEKFLHNLIDYFIEIGYTDDISDIEGAKKKICYLKYGESEADTIDITELYADLIQRACNPSENKSNNNVPSNLSINQGQEFRDILDLRANEKILQTGYDYFANFVTTNVKLSRVQGHLLNMARNIGKYMLLSGNREYLSPEWKERLCKLYGDVLEEQRGNKEAQVTDALRQEYQEAARKFSPKDLEKAINLLSKERNS